MVTSAPTFTAQGPGTAAEVWRAHLQSGHRSAASILGADRVIVVSAHPDDESLGAGGLAATARDADIPVVFVCATDGERSHPDSPTHTPEAMALRRRAEWEEAVDVLGPALLPAETHRLGLPDGELGDHLEELTTRLVEIVGDGRGTLLVTTWAEDGHPDHAALGRSAAAAARRTDAELWEYPIWFWHWAQRDDPRAVRLRPFALSQSALSTKERAVAAHASQVSDLTTLAGDEAVLTGSVLEHFRGDHEWFVITPGRDCNDDTLDLLHRRSADPWGTDSRWYEQRKRDLLLTVLPDQHVGRALEVGCSTGALTEALARRADRVVAVDRSAAAVAAAQRRLGDDHRVSVLELDIAAAWPDDGPFDLVVVSEVGYFLSPAGLDGLVERVASSLTPVGVVALCHWRHQVSGWLLDADGVHRRFAEGPLPPLQSTYRDRDVEIRIHAPHWVEPDR
ncbi:MAG: bifunctional PIG-L family deacetylase/class I SAM-dependent methyltransferase [Nocardioides sp.]